ncbi:hypothetical protein F5878DRAFT_498600, partial [Lentinula raphanica]
MALPETVPTLRSFSTGNMTRVDNVFCTPRLLERVVRCRVHHGAQPMKTDHFPIETVFDLRTSIVDPRQRRNWRKADWEELKEELPAKLEQLGEPKEIKTVEEFWTTLRRLDSALEELIEAHIPYAKPSPHQRRWWNEDLAQMRKARNNLGNKSYR